MSSSGSHSSAAEPIAVGGYTLDVNDSAGSRLALAATPADSGALRLALRRRGQDERDRASEQLDTTVEDASEVTSKIEHAKSVFEAFASGSLGIGALNDEADDLLALLGRLSGAKRWQDVVRVARRLSAILSLAERWIELLRSLRAALHAAKEAKDPRGEAWALHELGTLRLIAGRHAEADRDLGKAREIRERCGDSRGLAATNGNLQVLCQTLRRITPRGPVERVLHQLARRPALAAALAVTLIVVGGAGGAVLAHSHKREAVARPTVAHGPNAHFAFQPRSPKVGSPVSFDASSSYDPRAPIAGYRWDFGDGGSARGASAAHSFAQPRVYEVSLTVTDADGQRDTLTRMIVVTGTRTRQTSVVLRCPSGRSALGEAVTASGSIAPARPRVNVRVVYRSPAGRETALTPVSGAEGSYATSFTPEEAGAWSVRSSQAESGGYQASSSKPCGFSVAPQPPSPKETTTTINCPAGNWTPGEAVTVSGSITPARPGATVKLTYARSEREPTTETLKSDAKGSYETSFTPKEEGSWTVQSSQPESSEYRASASEPCAFSVSPG